MLIPWDWHFTFNNFIQMDGSILSVGTQEWISNTIVPIISIVVPVWVFLSMKSSAAMKGKVDVAVHDAVIKAVREEVRVVKDDIKEVKESNTELKKDIKADLTYLRDRLDKVLDVKQ